MNNDLSSNEIRRFYQELQENLVDNRSNTGRRHELAFVITLLIVSILLSYDHLSLSKIHRNMKRYYVHLCISLHKDIDRCISRTQLSRILSDFDYESFLSIQHKENDSCDWHAVDGKELKGSIDSKKHKTRGLSIVYAINTNSNFQRLLGFYDGTKESEKNVVRERICDLPEGSKVTLDALHNSVGLLTDIEQNNRFYLTQIKANQKHLMNDLVHISDNIKTEEIIIDTEKSHGRIDTRSYEIYPINVEILEPRWSESGICNMIKVTRKSYHLKDGTERKETRYYITNYNGKNAEISDAIRGHWKIEIMNRIRDVNFGEDKFRSLNHGLQKTMSSLMLFICSGLSKINSAGNLNVLREELVYNPKMINKFFAA